MSTNSSVADNLVASTLFNNSTSVTNSTVSGSTYEVNPETVFQFCCYITVGSSTVVANVLLIVAVMTTPSLRHRPEVLIYSGLSVGNVIYSTAFVNSGIRRMIIIFSGQIPLVSPWYCMTVVHSTFFLFGGMLVPIMDLVVSVDRMLCVVSISFYHGLSELRYCSLALGLPCCITVVFTACGWYLSSRMPRTPSVPITCILDYGLPTSFNQFEYLTEALLAILSCLLYGVVVAWFRVRQSSSSQKQHQQSNKAKENQRKRQAKVTRTLALVSTVTFFLNALPSLLKTAVNMSGLAASTVIVGRIGPYLALMSLSNSLMNALIYVAKQSDVRAAVRRLFALSGRNNNIVSVISAERSLNRASDIPMRSAASRSRI